MSLILNIYNNETHETEKTYDADLKNIMFGTIEDIIEVVDFNKLNDNTTWAAIISMSIKRLKPMLKEVFTGVTDEELQRTKINEIIPIFKEIFSYIMSEIFSLSKTSKKNTI